MIKKTDHQGIPTRLDMVVNALVALHMRTVGSGWCMSCIDKHVCRQASKRCSIPTIHWQRFHVHCKTDSLLTKNAAVTVLSVKHSELHVHLSTSAQ